MSIRKLTYASPSPFDEDFGKVPIIFVTLHTKKALFGSDGYCLEPARLIKVVKRTRAGRVISIKPKF